MTPSVSVRSVIGNKDDDGSENVARNKFAFFQTLTLLIKKKKKIYIYIYICLDFIQGACTESLDGLRSHYSPSQPMKLMTSQSLPPSSASSVMIKSHRIDLAGLGHRKNYLTLHCFLT